MAYTKYSLTPANNNATPPDGAPEGMLPSAVNDTMRDMMAQIRDCGDGIRDGTYTMTAPVITGGSITGVALSGNTFTSPVITGGSINNTPIGASTANTGAFTTLSASGATTFSGATVVSGSLTANTFSSSGATITGGSINSTTIGATTASTGRFSTITGTGLTSGRVIYATTNGQLTDDADFTFNGTTVTMANDASISGLTVGKGNNAISTNTAFGLTALAAATTGDFQVAVGRLALAQTTTGGINTAVGNATLYGNTTGSENSAFGGAALLSNTTGNYNVGIGRQALQSNTTASNNTAVGYQAGYSVNGSNYSVFLGSRVASLGATALTGNYHTLVGDASGLYLQGASTNNAFFGQSSGNAVTTGSKNTIIGSYTGNQDGLDIRTASNYAVISDGDGNRLLTTYNGGTLALDGGAVPNAGTGITFPATQSASSDANTLDDYEEGTWTPQLLSDGGSATGKTYATQVGKYTKIGNVVYFSFFVEFTNKGSNNVNEANLAGLPFTVSASAGAGGGYVQQWNNVGTNSIWFSFVFKNNNTAAYLSTVTAAATGTSYYLSTSYQNNTFFRGSGFYYID